MLDELARRAREGLEVPWDDLRHRRVLVRTLAELREQPAPRGRRPARRIAAAAGLLAAAGIALWLGVVPRDPISVTIAETPEEVAVFDAPAPSVDPVDDADLVLVDGTIVRLGPAARIELGHESLARIELFQIAGGVHYSVPEVAGREMFVQTSTITIIVAAAEFFVDVGVDEVTVRIERGAIDVVSGGRRVRLGPGEQVTLRGVLEASTEETPAPAEPARAGGREHATGRDRASGPSVEALLRRADEARRAGRFDDAAEALSTMLREHPRDPQVPAALFTLGRVERARGRHEAAGAAFEACWRKRKRGPLASDALGSAATEYQLAGRRTKATQLARLYIDRHPAGLHAATMFEIVR